MFQKKELRLRPVLMIALLSVSIPAIALAQGVAGSHEALLGHAPLLQGITVRSARVVLDLKQSLALIYEEQTLERQVRSTGAEAIAEVRNVLRRAPIRAVAAPAVSQHSWSADWYAIAQCESSGNWAANTGNGFWGGLQFTPSTWFAYGGGPFDGVGPFPYSSSQQIAVAERVLAGQGPGAWPNCFRWA